MSDTVELEAAVRPGAAPVTEREVIPPAAGSVVDGARGRHPLRSRRCRSWRRVRRRRLSDGAAAVGGQGPADPVDLATGRPRCAGRHSAGRDADIRTVASPTEGSARSVRGPRRAVISTGATGSRRSSSSTPRRHLTRRSTARPPGAIDTEIAALGGEPAQIDADVARRHHLDGHRTDPRSQLPHRASASGCHRDPDLRRADLTGRRSPRESSRRSPAASSRSSSSTSALAAHGRQGPRHRRRRPVPVRALRRAAPDRAQDRGLTLPTSSP